MTEDETNYWLRIFIRESLNVTDLGHMLINPERRYREEGYNNIETAWQEFKVKHGISE